MSKDKKQPAWVKDPTAENIIRNLRPQFGNMNHVRMGVRWNELLPLYKRQVKGKIVRDKIAGLEQEIIQLHKEDQVSRVLNTKSASL